MVEGQANFKKFVGNVCLHRELGVGRRFLRRNLRHILDTHEKLLQQTSNDALRQDMIANEKRSSGWDFPTREMLDDLMRGQKPILQVDSLQVRHHRSKAIVQKRSEREQNDETGLDWLPQPGAEFRLPCQVGITVLDTRTSKQRIYVDTRPGTITEERGERHPHYDIELDRPFLIELDKLFVVTDAGTNGFRHWKRTVTAKYVLEVTIQCQDSDDTAEFLSKIEGRDPSNYHNAPGNEGVLRASWESLPECPPEGYLMALRRAKGHKSIEPDYRLEVKMGWARKRDSPLERYNKKFAHVHAPSRQLPTPSASDDMDKTPLSYTITYNFQDGQVTRSTTIEGLFCPLCHHSREHSSFERLQLHCMTYHDHFKFESEEAEAKGASSTVRKIVWISLSEQPVGKPIGGGPDIRSSWIAPRRPFNVSAHVRGEDDWTGSGRTKTGTRRGRQGKDRERVYDSQPTSQPVRKRPAPEEVEDIPERSPKRRCVPNVPNVSFYHTTSKQLLNPGELMAESDDDVDESWLAQNQDCALEEMGITGAAKDFTRTFNHHLAREQSDSSVLTREALIRFTRIYHTKLQDVQWQLQFRAKLKQLRGVNIIGDETVTYCIRGLKPTTEAKASQADTHATAGADALTNGVESRDNGAEDRRPRQIWDGNKFITRDSAEPLEDQPALPNGDTPNTNQRFARSEGGAPNGDHANGARETNGEEHSARPEIRSNAKKAHVCICGKSAKDARGGIACADPVCTHSALAVQN